jgi:hypothetical protein
MLAGCAGDGATPIPSVKRLTANEMVDDHIAAAMAYQEKANQLRTDADRLEQQAQGISVYEDPKGFRRNALRTTVETLRQEAAEMEQFNAAHSGKAQTMMGKQPGQ